MTASLHILAGPNGSGKSTFIERVLQPSLHLPVVNADVIAAAMWPADTESHAYEASRLAAEKRSEFLDARRSFITETVFSHSSKTDLVRRASTLGYQVTIHVVLVPLGLSQVRVLERLAVGGHSDPRDKIASRYERLWGHINEARAVADSTRIYDNSTAKTPFRTVAEYTHGRRVWVPGWPSWSPLEP